MGKTLLVAVLLIAAGLFFVIHQPALPPLEASESAPADPALIERGRVLAGIGNCATCHTADGGKSYAGGRAFPTGFGTLYAANITPDRELGIGSWSREAFIRAMHKGIDRDGSYLFPAFPYTHFKNVTNDDLDALYAYLMSLKPVAYQPPENGLRFPFKLRSLQWGWQLLFFDSKPLQPDPGQSDTWNRGAYLAEGLGHCTACHSPRNAFGAEKKDRAYAGALVDNWYAPALNAQQPVPIHWTEQTLYDYLRSGQSPYQGVAAGSMSEVVHKGLKQASDKDIRAMAVYLASLGNDDAQQNDAAALAASTIDGAQQRTANDRSHGENLYIGACTGCHYNAADKPIALRAELSLNSAVTADDPTNLLRVLLQGIAADQGTPGFVMPEFATLSDDDIVSLADFLRRRAAREPWPDLHKRLTDLRKDLQK
ncbi:cytochrome c [Microbulbifer sp. SAOS-129_SWC]|uniref:cytochrome c n=1 Tax=Microbulbifer sp. SAOS-129_SWC TaxID=3145235 RepID=UPI003217166A